jgi:toxin-antitoxin system PIN domain toxin
MRKLLDVNAWMALSLPQHPQHQAARDWYQAAPLTKGDLLFCRPAEMGFLRLITQQRVMERFGLNPLTNAEAVAYLAQVYGDPAVSAAADEPAGTRPVWLKAAATPWPSPNVWMDAYLAALAIHLGAEMVTFDQGFKSYTPHGLKLVLLTP